MTDRSSNLVSKVRTICETSVADDGLVLISADDVLGAFEELRRAPETTAPQPLANYRELNYAQLCELAAQNERDAFRYRYIRACLHLPETDILVTSRRKAPPDLGVYSSEVLDSIIDVALGAVKSREKR